MHLLCNLPRSLNLPITSRDILPGGGGGWPGYTKTIWGSTLGNAIHQTLPSPSVQEYLECRLWCIWKGWGFGWALMCLFGFPSGFSLVCGYSGKATAATREEAGSMRWDPAPLGCWKGLLVTKDPFPSVPSCRYSTSLLGLLGLSSFLMEDRYQLWKHPYWQPLLLSPPPTAAQRAKGNI